MQLILSEATVDLLDRNLFKVLLSLGQTGESTVHDIMASTGIKSRTTVHDVVRRLETLGFITKEQHGRNTINNRRYITLNSPDNISIQIPLFRSEDRH